MLHVKHFPCREFILGWIYLLCFTSLNECLLTLFCDIHTAFVYLAANHIEGKKICKLFVQRGLGLAAEGLSSDSEKVPLVICITRLVAQKGLHFIINAIRHVEELVSLSLSLSIPILTMYDDATSPICFSFSSIYDMKTHHNILAN